MKSIIQKVLFRLARSRASALFLGVAFAHLSPLMPLKRRLDEPTLLVFAHPRPFWSHHWLAVAKRRVPHLLAANWDEPADQAWLLALLRAVQKMPDVDLLLLNGGQYQDVPQLHVHLRGRMAENGRLPSPPFLVSASATVQLGSAKGYPAVQDAPGWCLVSETAVSSLRLLDGDNPAVQQALLDLFRLAQHCVREGELAAYRLQILPDQAPLTLHILP